MYIVSCTCRIFDRTEHSNRTSPTARDSSLMSSCVTCTICDIPQCAVFDDFTFAGHENADCQGIVQCGEILRGLSSFLDYGKKMTLAVYIEMSSQLL